MNTSKTNYHYITLNKEPKIKTAITHNFSADSEKINNEVCLVNTCYDYTGFESIPKNVEDWLNEIGLDFSHFPNLTRLWGKTRSEYGLTLRYEIAHEFIAKEIPYAIVRLSEKAACYEQHELEIAFIYPCEPKKVMDMEFLNPSLILFGI